MSKNFKINHYDDFKCIADQCSFTCCKEWRIAVDKDTLERWKGKTLEGERIHSHVVMDGGGHCIKLNDHKECPFLNDDKLCRLVVEKGEEMLSHTCTTFPRQINSFKDRTEYALDTGCPAVIDLLKDYEGILCIQGEGREKVTDTLFDVRDFVMELLQEKSYTLPERMMMIFYVLLELSDKKKITKAAIENYKKPEVLAPLVQAIQGMKFNGMDCFLESNELFHDVVDNYRKQKLYVDYLESIAVKAENIETTYTDRTLVAKVKAFEQVAKDYENLIKNYLVSEVVANCLQEEMTLEDVLIGFEWLAMTYVTIRQAIFLKWLETGEGELTYETVRDYLTVMARVTGYGHMDIREYLENSFEEVIWEWGYLALIVGNGTI